MAIELPEILNIPPKLLPLITKINNYRYFMIEGGRSSGKSQSIARLVCWLAEQKTLRICCGREIQNTIEESVYTIFRDLIRVNSLNFTTGATKIDHKATESSIRFRGFREQGAINIKGLEGVDVLWVDEAQAITKQTLDVIIPTIRKENSKVIWSMNRHVVDDPVYSFFFNRPDCLHIHIDYHENPFCPKAMMLEAEECKKTNIDDYNHIWLGQPLRKADDYLLDHDVVHNSPKLQFFQPSPMPRKIMAVDVARYGGDEIVYTVLENYGAVHWAQIHQDTQRNKSLMETTGKIIEMRRDFDVDLVVIDDTGVGGGVTDRLAEMDIEVVPFNGAEKTSNLLYANKRCDAYMKLKEWFDKGWLKIIADKVLMEQLLSIQFTHRSNGQKIIFSKEEMRKKDIKSPDRADALMMAVFYAEKAFEVNKMPAYGAPAGDLMAHDALHPEHAIDE